MAVKNRGVLLNESDARCLWRLCIVRGNENIDALFGKTV